MTVSRVDHPIEPGDVTSSADDLPRAGSPGVPLPASLHRSFIDHLTRSVSSSQEAATVTTRAPFDGSALAELPQSTPADVTAAAVAAREVQRTWVATPVEQRAAVFLRMHDLVLSARDEIMDLVQAENGKARRDAFLEVADIAGTCRYYGRAGAALLRPHRRRGVIPGLTAVRELRHPKGLVVIVSPWNYPFSLGVGDAIPALIAGNAVLQKPDNQTALTALRGLGLAEEAGLPPGLWQIVLGRGSSIGDSLMDAADFVMFTGSTASGRSIAEQAGRRLIDCSLELGGKNAMLVLRDADLGRAVEGGVRACFSSSGQLCISTERMYVADEIYDRFVPRFVEAVRSMRLGPAYDFGCQMGSLTNAEQLEATRRHVDAAIAGGATLLTGGRPRPDLGPYFYEPTVLADVTPDMACFAEETFGPVVSVYRFSDGDDVVARANDTRYGLNASIWTRSSRGHALAGRLRAGTVNVNEAYAAAWGSIDAPMGGMGDSGIGRRHGAHGLLKYTEPQTVARQRLLNPAPPIRRMGDNGFAVLMTASLRALKRLGVR